jgi:hypothetical protein
MPRAPKVVALHVGAHKTGTSVLQNFLSENPNFLRRRRIMRLSRTRLAAAVGWGERLVDEPQRLGSSVDALRGSRRFLMALGSLENIVGRPFRAGAPLYPDAARNFAALAAVLRPFEPGVRPRIVLSIRPQADFLESYYLQTIQQGGHHSFEQWLAGIDLADLSWRPVVDALVDAFGAPRCAVIDFRLIRAGQDAYLRGLLAALDPRLDVAVRYPATRNRSISARGLQIALAANPLLETGPEQRAMRQFLQEHFSNLDQPRPALLTEAQRADLEDRYAGEYDELVVDRGAGGGR